MQANWKLQATQPLSEVTHPHPPIQGGNPTPGSSQPLAALSLAWVSPIERRSIWFVCLLPHCLCLFIVYFVTFNASFIWISPSISQAKSRSSLCSLLLSVAHRDTKFVAHCWLPKWRRRRLKRRLVYSNYSWGYLCRFHPSCRVAKSQSKFACLSSWPDWLCAGWVGPFRCLTCSLYCLSRFGLFT